MKKLLFGALLLQNFPAALASSGTNPTLSPHPLPLLLALTTATTPDVTSQDNSYYQPATGFTTCRGKNTQHDQNALFQNNKKHHNQTQFPKKNNGEKLRKNLSQNQ